MKILQVVPSFLPGWRYGGPIRSVYGLSQALLADGHEVEVFTSNRDEQVILDVPHNEPVMLDGLTVRYFKTKGPARLRYSPDLDTEIERSAGRFDVAHVHGVFNWLSYASARSARRAGIPYVISPRGMLMADAIALRSRARKGLWLRLLERENLEGAGALHLTAQNEVDELPNLSGLAWPPQHLIPNGVERMEWNGDRERLDPDMRELIARENLVLFLGRLNWKKGLDRLVEAMALTDERLHLGIVGPNDGYLKTVLRMRKRLGLESRISVFEAASGDTRRALLNCARVAVLPSYSENFGNAATESMAVGCPVVVTPEVGMSSFVSRFEAGAVVKGEPALIAAALDRLCLDEEAHAAASAGATRAYEEALGWPSCSDAMEAVYREAIATTARRPRRSA
jgi:glycosyltransferase involved in cell wall biosynthesis